MHLVSKMKHIKKFVLSTIGVSLLAMFLLSLALVPSDAAAILDTPHSAATNIGNSFSIDAVGEALYLNDTASDRALTKMHIEFTIVRNGSRGVFFLVSSGSFKMNYTSYSMTDGIGIAARPEQSPFNTTLVFGFRVNMTQDDGKIVQLSFRGFVDRFEADRPILYMRGRITFDNLVYNLIQRGRIHRLDT